MPGALGCAWDTGYFGVGPWLAAGGGLSGWCWGPQFIP